MSDRIDKKLKDRKDVEQMWVEVDELQAHVTKIADFISTTSLEVNRAEEVAVELIDKLEFVEKFADEDGKNVLEAKAEITKFENRRAELVKMKKDATKKLATLRKRSTELYKKIHQVREAFETEKMQPELRLKALKAVESNANPNLGAIEQQLSGLLVENDIVKEVLDHKRSTEERKQGLVHAGDDKPNAPLEPKSEYVG